MRSPAVQHSRSGSHRPQGVPGATCRAGASRACMDVVWKGQGACQCPLPARTPIRMQVSRQPLYTQGCCRRRASRLRPGRPSAAAGGRRACMRVARVVQLGRLLQQGGSAALNLKILDSSPEAAWGPTPRSPRNAGRAVGNICPGLLNPGSIAACKAAWGPTRKSPRKAGSQKENRGW